MVLKNTELSYRVCQLEEKVTELEKYKRELVGRAVVFVGGLDRFCNIKFSPTSVVMW